MHPKALHIRNVKFFPLAFLYRSSHSFVTKRRMTVYFMERQQQSQYCKVQQPEVTYTWRDCNNVARSTLQTVSCFIYLIALGGLISLFQWQCSGVRRRISRLAQFALALMLASSSSEKINTK